MCVCSADHKFGGGGVVVLVETDPPSRTPPNAAHARFCYAFKYNFKYNRKSSDQAVFVPFFSLYHVSAMSPTLSITQRHCVPGPPF